MTLDDLQVTPIGVRKRARRLTAAVALLALAGIGYSFQWIFDGSFDRFFTDAVEQATPEGDDLAETLGGIFTGALAGGLVAGVVLALVVPVMSFFGATLLFAWRSHSAVRRG